MKIIKFFLILLLITITSCGYKPLFSKKGKVNYSITEYDLKGEKLINKKIITLINTINGDDSINLYTLEMISEKKKETLAKDSEGNSSIFRSTINVDLVLRDGKKIIKKEKFSSSFSYNNIKNKFDLSQYQKNVEDILINKISDEILMFLSS
tara:strand:- start:428 stop:883 length:456 start_codon:yes stop_codon:yes gene_type:complete